MFKSYVTKAITLLAVIFSFSLCFAQSTPPKLAVYVSGAENAGVNKSLSAKLLVAMTQSGSYTEITDPALLQDELAKSKKSDIASITQAAKRHGAEYVCIVGMTEAFGAYSIVARLAGVSDLQVLKTASVDRSLNSMDDLTAVSIELVRQLLTTAIYTPIPLPQPLPPPQPPVAAALVDDIQAAASAAALVLADTAVVVAAAAPQCAKKYNVNELLFKVKDVFPSKLKDCSATLAKDMLMPASFGGHKLAPAQFMTQCPVDEIKKELPEGFPGVDKFLVKLTNFVQTLMNSAMAGGSLDPKKLISVVASMDINGLLNEAKKLSEHPCVVDEPYEPPVEQTYKQENYESAKGGEEEEKSSVSLGIRVGANSSYTYSKYDTTYSWGWRTSKYGNYDDIIGMQVGFVVDFPVVGVFHSQIGLMYIQKGMADGDGYGLTSHNLEIPLLLSFKFSAFRLNFGPYIDLCLRSDYDSFAGDFGINTGFGFDIDKFYIGMFYDYGLTDVSNVHGFEFYNRTIGLNLGINL